MTKLEYHKPEISRGPDYPQSIVTIQDIIDVSATIMHQYRIAVKLQEMASSYTADNSSIEPNASSQAIEHLYQGLDILINTLGRLDAHAHENSFINICYSPELIRDCQPIDLNKVIPEESFYQRILNGANTTEQMIDKDQTDHTLKLKFNRHKANPLALISQLFFNL